MEVASFACPACGKSYRLKPGMAGKKVGCKCGERFRVPEEDAEGDGPIELSDAAPAWLADAKPMAGPANCSRCNARLKPEAVLCLNCGTDQRTGRPAAAPVVTSAGAGDDSEDEAGEGFVDRWRMTATLWGINAQLLALLCKGLALLLIFAAFFASGTPAVAYAAVAAELTAGVLGFAGAVLCLMAPIALLGRVTLAVSLLCYAAGFGSGLWVEVGGAPDWAELTASILNLLGLFLFLGYLMSLAEHLDFPEVTQTAGKVFGYSLGAILTAVLVGWLPFVGLFVLIGTLALAGFAIYLYVTLLIDLSRSVAYRRDRG